MQKMTIEEVIEILSVDVDFGKEIPNLAPVYDVAVEALKELSLYKQGGLVLIPADVYQKQCDELDAYKAIDTELKEKYNANVDIKMLMQYFIETIFKGEKHEGFKILTNEDAKMWDAYKAIGTVEEIKALKEAEEQGLLLRFPVAVIDMVDKLFSHNG